MKLRALELAQFRKFDRPVRVAGFADGLNLLVGPNEMGKSTLFTALRAALFERHRSQAQAIRSLQPAGHEGAAPRVALEFEIAGARHRIEKRFLRRPTAELALPDGRRLHDAAAEEALDELLRGGPGAAGGGTGNLDVWHLLWVDQGRSLALPDVAAGGRGALQAALDREVGELLGGDHGAALIAAVEQALQELVYRRGGPRGRYREVTEALNVLREEIDRLERDRRELEDDLAALETAEQAVEALRAEEAAGEETAELDRLADRREALRVRAAELREAEAAVAATRHGLAEARAAVDRWRALVAAEAELAEADSALGQAGSTASAAAARVEEETNRVARLKATLAEAERHRRGLDRLAEAVRERDHARAALHAAASEVVLEIEPPALARVRVDGRPLAASRRSLRIVDPLAIEIEGIGRIAVHPVVADRRRLLGSLRDAQRRIAQELDALGLRPPEPAARQLHFDLAAGAPSEAPNALLGEPGEESGWPQAATVEAARTEAERQLGTLHAQLGPAREALERARAEAHRELAARERALARHEQAGRVLAELRTAATTIEEEPPLAARVAALERELALAELHLRNLAEEAPAESLDALEERIAGLRRAIDRRAATRRERELEIAGLRARIQALAGGGLDERLAAARRRFDELDREAAKYRRETEALQLLLRVLRDAERDAKERYLGPLARRIRTYLQRLFPGATLEIDEAFRITAVAREGGAEAFDRLSEGTQEQIAILTRLAFAELLADHGHPVVVVLDDALVFSDDRRIAQMFEILADAARRFQIVVLTCRERVFEDLTATRLRLEPLATAELT